MKVLLTAFGPFPGAPVNPTPELVRGLARRAGPHRIEAHVFATVYADVVRDLPAVVALARPDLIVLFGLATRSPVIRVETMARPRTAPKRDAAGRKPPASPFRAGAVVRHTRLPADRLVAAVRAVGVPARLSRDPGLYLCNFTFWHALAPGMPPSVFVHVPLSTGTIPALRRAAGAILSALLSSGHAVPKRHGRRRHAS